jgi:hypothetical protein
MTQDNAIWPYICNNYNLQAPYFGTEHNRIERNSQQLNDSVMIV